MIAMWRRMREASGLRERTVGQPKSANGASSLHLAWEIPQVPLIEVSAVLEILQPPVVRRLFFWALQVSFATDRSLRGGAHIGLQWNPRFPGLTAANWGGYAPAEIGGLLKGSASPLPSARNDVNTRDFDWQPGPGAGQLPEPRGWWLRQLDGDPRRIGNRAGDRRATADAAGGAPPGARGVSRRRRYPGVRESGIT